MSSPVQILFLFTLLLIPLKFWLPASTIENISNQISSLGQPNIAPTPIEPDVIPVAYRHFDIVVYGDELPGICAAIWARKTLGPDQKIALVRQQDESALFGGLLTRGGLSYLDFDKTPYWAEQPYSQCFQEFIKRSEIAEACVEPVKASQAIAQMLQEANITILHGVTLQPKVESAKIKYVKVNYSKSFNTQKDLRIKSEIYIDATQNAELAQKAG
ncbi:MAG: FAD-dependent oxidoreductase, partial [Microcoleaceae cyanobacterium]